MSPKIKTKLNSTPFLRRIHVISCAYFLLVFCCLHPYSNVLFWKMGQVTPLFKKGDEFCKNNFRPVSVLPALNNIFERILAKQLEPFYQDILSDFISAYRPNFRCETSLLRLTEDWRKSRDSKETVAVVSMDLSKAFDSIPHALLLAKLKAYGLGETSIVLLRSYLSTRIQRVKIGDTFSEWEMVRRGVPQGSVLHTCQLSRFYRESPSFPSNLPVSRLEHQISRENPRLLSNSFFSLISLFSRSKRKIKQEVYSVLFFELFTIAKRKTEQSN